MQMSKRDRTIMIGKKKWNIISSCGTLRARHEVEAGYSMIIEVQPYDGGVVAASVYQVATNSKDCKHIGRWYTTMSFRFDNEGFKEIYRDTSVEIGERENELRVYCELAFWDSKRLLALIEELPF